MILQKNIQHINIIAKISNQNAPSVAKTQRHTLADWVHKHRKVIVIILFVFSLHYEKRETGAYSDNWNDLRKCWKGDRWTQREKILDSGLSCHEGVSSNTLIHSVGIRELCRSIIAHASLVGMTLDYDDEWIPSAIAGRTSMKHLDWHPNPPNHL